MIENFLQFLAPHYCYSCAKVGSVLCQNCKYDIVDEAVDACIVCVSPASTGICPLCHSTYDAAWFVGDRTHTLKQLIDDFKFARTKAATTALVDLLDARLPVLPAATVIVPVPTISSHIRMRGYDHALLIARGMAQSRDLSLLTCLERSRATQQRGKKKRERFEQVKSVFVCKRQLDPSVPYLLIDDIVTTGATLQACASALKAAGLSGYGRQL